jgi:hypothetical protein
MNKVRYHQRQEQDFDARFAVGEDIVRYMEKHACKKKVACDHLALKYPTLGSSALRAAHTTAKMFPPQDRNRAAGYTRHQCFAEVSRKNLPFVCTDEEYRHGVLQALEEAARRDLPVNMLNNGPETAKVLLIRAIRRIRRRRQGIESGNNTDEIRFPLVHGTKTISIDDVKRLEDEA